MKIEFIKNKKADIPITILVIMIVAACILAILSFFVSITKVEKNYLGVELINGINTDIEKFYFYLNAGFSEDEAAEKIDAEVVGNKLIIHRDKKIKEENIISVQYGMNIVRRFEENN